MRNWKRNTLSMVAAAAMALVLVAAPASAEGNTQISGVGVFVSTAECSDLPSPYYAPIKMAGDRLGASVI
jgi:hypothetical protein